MIFEKTQIERIDMRLCTFSVLALVTATGHSAALAEGLPESGRFEAELKALVEYDRSTHDPVGALFIGSSSIRLWNVNADFAAYRPLNHGFGGATVVDVLANYDLLTARYAPETIIVYVGENDIVQGRDATAVAADVITLLTRLRGDFPKTRILYLSMKSSPARWVRRSAFEQANRQIRTKSEESRNFDYIDASTSLLLPGDAPDPECFNADGIHLSALGYQRWRKIIDNYLPVRTVTAPALPSPDIASPSAATTIPPSMR